MLSHAHTSQNIDCISIWEFAPESSSAQQTEIPSCGFHPLGVPPSCPLGHPLGVPPHSSGVPLLPTPAPQYMEPAPWVTHHAPPAPPPPPTCSHHHNHPALFSTLIPTCRIPPEDTPKLILCGCIHCRDRKRPFALGQSARAKAGCALLRGGLARAFFPFQTP